MAGSLTIPNTIFALPGPTQPATVLDQNWTAISTYVNSREITFGLAAAMPGTFVGGQWFFQTDTKQLFAGNGATPTLVASLNGVQNVFAFGAKGDGVTDDKGAIQAAINAGGLVYFPKPSVAYLIGSALTLAPGVALVGADPNVVIIAGADNFTMINFLTSAGTPTDFTIKNLKLSGNGHANITGISLDGNVSGMRLSEVWIQDVVVLLCAVGIKLRYVANAWLTNCFLSACVIAYQIVISADINFVDCQAQNGSGAGFLIQGDASVFAQGLRMTGCSTNGQGQGLVATQYDWADITGCSFTTTTGNVCEMNTCLNWDFTGCQFANGPATSAGFIAASCQNIQVTGCFFALNSEGIALSGSKHVISSCTFEAGSGVDIILDSALHCAVLGNVCDSTGNAVSISEANTANYNAATGNVMHGTLTWNINGNSVSSGNIQSYV